MPECVHMMCDRTAKKRGLCLTHYSRMHYARTGPMTTLDELCQAGLNRACVDCDSVPFGGGRRCLECFQARAIANRGDHVHSEPPSQAGYSLGCRCRDCKAASAEYARERRARKRAAA